MQYNEVINIIVYSSIVGIQFKFIAYSIYRAIANKSKFSCQRLIKGLSGGYCCCVDTKIVHFTDFFINFTKPVLLAIIDARNVILKIKFSVCFLKPGFGLQIRANSSIKIGFKVKFNVRAFWHKIDWNLVRGCGWGSCSAMERKGGCLKRNLFRKLPSLSCLSNKTNS